ncbi:MAG: 4Fe-4S binding protein [Verrucomicrobiota bacterium]
MSRPVPSSRRIRWASLVVSCVLALPLPLGIWAGFHLRLSPLLFLQSMLVSTPLVPIAFGGGVCLVIILFKDRWFCRFVCPTGALCDSLSETRKHRQLWRRLPAIQRWLALFGLGTAAFGFPIIGFLDPIALFQSAWAPVHLGMTVAAWLSCAGLFLILGLSWLVPYAWCRKLCPLGGLQSVATQVRRALSVRWRQRSNPDVVLENAAPMPPASSSSEHVEGWRRRNLLIVGTGLGASWLLGKKKTFAEAAPLRPPGSRPEDSFFTSCVRCGNCTRACPTHIISPSLDLQDPLGLLAPKLNFDEGHCDPACNACSQVCPTGAIQPFGLKEKPRIRIGTALINLEGCVMARGGECRACLDVCPYEAIETAEVDFQGQPKVIVDKCVGCGVCVNPCPTKVISIVSGAVKRD